MSVESIEPIFDPTNRTLEAFQREIHLLKEKLDTAIDFRSKLTQEKIDGVHREIEIRESHRLEREITAEAHRLELKADNQRTVETAMTAAEKAVQAALAAAEKARDQQTIATNLANSKSETAMAKALSQITETFTAGIANSLTQITNVKELALGSEQFRQGSVNRNTEHRLNSGLFVAIGAGIITSVSTMVTIGVTLYLGLKR